LSCDGLAVNVAPVTLSVTGMLPGLPVAPVEVTVTVPVCCPTDRPARPAGLMDTLMDCGTVPLAVADSQADAAPVDVVKAMPAVPLMFTIWAAGVLPPTV